jgi:hypothetical protein
MLIDLRVYRYLPGKFQKFLRSYEQFGFPLTSRHLGKTLGIFTSESGVQNRTFQFFMYESSGHRERCRIGMLADPEWHAFVKMDSDALLEQMNTLLRPTAFSPVGGERLPPPVLVTAGPARLFELTTWTTRADRFDEALKLLNDNATGALAGVGPQTIGYFVAETGCRAQILRLAAFASEEDRDAYAALAANDTDMRSFQTALRSLIVHEDSTLLCPTPYSPLR